MPRSIAIRGVIEGAPRRFDRSQLPQAVRVLLHREVQLRVGAIQVGVTAATVGQPRHRDLAEHRGQRAGVPGLDAAAGHLLGVEHLLQALLALRPQLEHAELETELEVKGRELVRQLMQDHLEAGGAL